MFITTRPEVVRDIAEESAQPPIAATSTAAPQKNETNQRPLTPRSTLSLLNAATRCIDPSLRSRIDTHTHSLALRQAVAGRRLMYFPGEVLQAELAKAASAFLSLLEKMTEEDQLIFLRMDYETNELLPRQTLSDVQKVCARLIAHDASATDRAVFMTIMGFIGKRYMAASKKRSKNKQPSAKGAPFLQMFSANLVNSGYPALDNSLVDRLRLSGDSEALAPRKREEQPREHEKDAQDDIPKLRNGLHGMGAAADAALKIDPDNRLPDVSWPLAKIQTERIASYVEPLVDHMSGRAAKTLMIWDMLCGSEADDLYTGRLHAGKIDASERIGFETLGSEERKARTARMAGVSGMLMALGYHSALELSEAALDYLGQPMRGELDSGNDAGQLLGQGAATDIMIELLEQQTAAPGLAL